MKKLLLTLLLTGLFTASQAQEEKEAVRKIGIRFEQFYNSKMYDSIYTIFAPSMTAALSLNATRDFLTSIQKQSGKIIKSTFIKYINGSFASYKTYFEKQILSVNISVNAQSLINGLEVTEFKNDQPEAPERNSSKLQFPGEKVVQGQELGLCGNSGNSSEPHIHFHVQNTENMMNATGIKCYFDSININGEWKKDYSPVQKDLIKQ